MRFHTAILSTLLLTACIQDPANLLTLSDRDPVTRFAVVSGKGTLWEIHAVKPTVLDRITYGQVPAGYEQIVPAPPAAPRAFLDGEHLDLYVATTRAWLRHNGVAEAPASFHGGVYEAGNLDSEPTHVWSQRRPL